eukprot:12282117-Ditylum_brightwellii.AAC.1
MGPNAICGTCIATDVCGTSLGTWKNFQYDIKPQEGVKMYHGKLYTVPKAYEAMLHMELDNLCKIGALCKVNQSNGCSHLCNSQKGQNSKVYLRL